MGKYKNYINEISKTKLISNTDPARLEKAYKEMRVRPPKVLETPEGYERLEYSFKMSPPEKSVEGRNHRGFMEYNPKTGDVSQLHCDCRDYYFRLYSPMVKANLDSWDLDKVSKKRQTFIHNKQWTKKTNPSGKLFICKHLASLIHNYMTDIPG